MEYNQTVIDYFENPVNVGKIEDPSAIGEAGSPKCGDSMRLYLKVDKNEVITDVKFKTFGCGAAIASSSMLTELIKGKTITEASQTTNKEVINNLGGLPPIKEHCSVLAEDALDAALKDYKNRKSN
jgi:nitrogen fixation NifU-like protein